MLERIEVTKCHLYSFVPNRRTGLFVKTAADFAYRFVCCGQVRLIKKCLFLFTWQPASHLVAHSSVRVITNYLL